MLTRLALGAITSILLGVYAYRKRWLSVSGFIALLISGSIIWGGGDWSWYLSFLFFFVSASLLTMYQLRRKGFMNAIVAKSGPRDIWQALANVGLPVAVAIIQLYTNPTDLSLSVAFVGSLAAVTADKWATEIGILSKSQPYFLADGKHVPPGTSGAISFLGILAGASGALLLSAVSAIAMAGNYFWSPFVLKEIIQLIITGTVGGTSGMFIDSLLGATLQAKYYCPVCQKMTEQELHSPCHQRTYLQSGLRWLNNEWVNFVCSLSGLSIALAVSLFFAL